MTLPQFLLALFITAVVVGLGMLLKRARARQRERIERWRKQRQSIEAFHAQVPVYDRDADDDDDDEREDATPAESAVHRRSLPVVDVRQCGGCTNWDHATGQIELKKNPVFARVLGIQQPYEMSMRRNPVHIEAEHKVVMARREIRELKGKLRLAVTPQPVQDMASARPAEDGSGAVIVGMVTPPPATSAEISRLNLLIHEAEEELVRLEAELAPIPQYEKGLEDEGVRKGLGVRWDDYGLCTKQATLTHSRDTCEHFEARP